MEFNFRPLVWLLWILVLLLGLCTVTSILQLVLLAR